MPRRRPPANLEQAIANWLDHKVARENLMARYDAIHAQLRCGNDERVAQALSPWLQEGQEGDATLRRPALAA